MENNTATETLTTVLTSGLVVTAKAYHWGIGAKQYTNLTQAVKAAAKLGEGWTVYGMRPYYVGRVTAVSQ